MTTRLGSLHSAFDDAMSEARTAVKALGPVAPDDHALLMASEEERVAWLSLDDITTRLNAIRATRDVLTLHYNYRAEYDTKGLFRTYEHPEAVSHPDDIARIAPDEPRARIVWEITSGVSPWLPRPTKQDERYAEYQLATNPNMPGQYAHQLRTLIGAAA